MPQQYLSKGYSRGFFSPLITPNETLILFLIWLTFSLLVQVFPNLPWFDSMMAEMQFSRNCTLHFLICTISLGSLDSICVSRLPLGPAIYSKGMYPTFNSVLCCQSLRAEGWFLPKCRSQHSSPPLYPTWPRITYTWLLVMWSAAYGNWHVPLLCSSFLHPAGKLRQKVSNSK